ncbi:hypothetical protein DRO91_08990 [Candidatus Heimdallarchaeota archaeon]|nr:MAG: hypothetical protein DRO91_08990 [Candidatus Heimdallarchaeota archaeon]
MPRPRRCRRVGFMPSFTYFKPAGVRIVDFNENVLTVGEFEAVRLKDLEGLEQKECAEMMDISQPTFHRLLLSARKKIADSIANGKAIKIEGGEYNMAPQMRGRGRGRGGGFASGPGGDCLCPNCGHREPHQLGVPCYNRKCPKCGAPMTRA